MNFKTKAILSASLIVTILSVAYAVFVANYMIPNDGFVTTKPGIGVFDANDAPVNVIHWGDVQQSMSKNFDIRIRNTAGKITMYIIDASLVHDLPASIGTLTWNFPVKYGGDYAPYKMVPGGGSGPGDGLITLHLAISPTAPEGSFSFSITINAYDTATG